MPKNATEKPFPREILNDKKLHKTASLLQQDLSNLIDLTLVLKQAHWNVVGANFRSVHLQLDEILTTVRDASDEVAERLATLGVAPDGRSTSVSQQSQLEEYPDGFNDVSTTLKCVSDTILATTVNLRKSMEQLGDLDPVSEDMAIGICGPLEKHLWMLQAQEV